MKVGTMWIRMIQRLFGKRTKVHRLPKEKVKENGTNDLKEEFADENKDQEHLQAEMKTSQKRLEDSHEILLSLHMTFRKHAECSENLLSEMEKLIDAIKKTKTADMEVSQAVTPVPGSFSPSSSSFSSARIRLPPIKELQHSSVDNLHTDDAKSSQSFKLAWAANESSNDTEETFLTGTEKNEIDLQTVEELSTEQETRSLTIDDIQNKPLDGKIRRLEMEFQAEKDKWEEEKLKLKHEMAEAKQKRQKKTKDLKLKIKCLEKEAKREKQERKQAKGSRKGNKG
ncbi:nucleolar protein 58-like [Trichomycterus rosablanca]|uniref:nucleolar protein 58-like n=1 Tax=Trichomycterus rosablanca TaxID=2290929 RepID=UPI002F35A8B3